LEWKDVNKKLIGKGMEGNGCGVICGTILTCVCGGMEENSEKT
jgi:hypothetical protein